MRLLDEESEDSKNFNLFHIVGRKLSACPKWTSVPGGIIGWYCAIEASMTEGEDMALLLVTPSVM